MQIKLVKSWPQVLKQYFKYYCFSDYGSFLFKNRTTRLMYLIPFLLLAFELITPYNTFLLFFQLVLVFAAMLIPLFKIIPWFFVGFGHSEYCELYRNDIDDPNAELETYYIEHWREFSTYPSRYDRCIEEVEYSYNFSTYTIRWEFRAEPARLHRVTVNGCFPPYSIITPKKIYEMALEQHRANNLKLEKQRAKVLETIRIKESIEQNGLIKSLIQTSENFNQAGQLSLVEKVTDETISK